MKSLIKSGQTPILKSCSHEADGCTAEWSLTRGTQGSAVSLV